MDFDPTTPFRHSTGTLAWASHASAARVYDLPIPTIADEHVSVPRAGRRRRHQGVIVHVGSEAGTRVVRGVRVSEPRMLFVELAGRRTCAQRQR